MRELDLDYCGSMAGFLSNGGGVTSSVYSRTLRLVSFDTLASYTSQ